MKFAKSSTEIIERHLGNIDKALNVLVEKDFKKSSCVSFVKKLRGSLDKIRSSLDMVKFIEDTAFQHIEENVVDLREETEKAEKVTKIVN